jgi:hypothetical protein
VIILNLEDIASFCEFRDCEISLGGPQIGFIHLNGNGVKYNYNYDRFLSLSELSALAKPADVLKQAAIFKIRRGGQVRELSRAEFEMELQDFQQKAGIA